MGILDFIKKGTQELFIARPEEAKEDRVYKWPDQTIPNMSRITVGEDESALFFRDGKFVGELKAGSHPLNSNNIPFLGSLVDTFTGGNALRAEIWFVTTREVGGVMFGGKVGDLEDPKSEIAVGLMVHGDCSLKIDDAVKALALFGLKKWTRDEQFVGWFKDQVLKVIRDRIAEMVVKQDMPLLDVTSGAYTEEIETLVIEGVKRHLVAYGVQMVQLGNFVVSMKEEDEQKLKAFSLDTADMRRAEKLKGGMQGYQQYATAKAMMGAGEGMAKGGGGGGPMLEGAGLGVGFGMAQMFQRQAGQPPPPPEAPPPPPAAPTAPGASAALVDCPKCQAQVASGKFCAECGGALPAKKPFCVECGKPLTGTKFCGECGAKQGP